MSAESRAAFKERVAALLSGDAPNPLDDLCDLLVQDIERIGTQAQDGGYRRGIARYCGEIVDQPNGKVSLGKLDIVRVARQILADIGVDATPTQAVQVAHGILRMMTVRRDLIVQAIEAEMARVARVGDSFPYLTAGCNAAISALQMAAIIARDLLPSEVMSDGTEPS
jgi:hypothetical protein